MAAEPRCGMGPPPRSFAADAHGCIMVRVSHAHRIQARGATTGTAMASSPPTVPRHAEWATHDQDVSQDGVVAMSSTLANSRKKARKINGLARTAPHKTRTR